jgi:hypothetical protein
MTILWQQQPPVCTESLWVMFVTWNKHLSKSNNTTT